MSLFFLFFFFQAEDGIRDLYVTGVQTCALPISDVFPAPRAAFDDAAARERWAEVLAAAPHPLRRDPPQPAVDVIVVQRSPEPPTRCLSALAGQSYSNFGVIVVAACDAESAPGDVLAGKRPVTTVRCEGCSTESARRSGLAFGNAPWVVFL